MVTLRFALVCALGALLLAPQVAAGGGWWSYINLERSTVTAGQRVEMDEEVMFSSAAAAADARGRFHVFLLRGFDDSVVERAMREAAPRDWWSLGDADAIRVGRVEVGVLHSNLGRARAAFTVPELPAGTYHLMLCDAACAEPLADVIPFEGFTVVADPATARIAQRVDRVQRQLRDQAGRLATARAEAERARADALRTQSEVEQLARRVASAADVGRRSPEVRWEYAGWLVAGALAAIVLVRRLRRHAPGTMSGPSLSNDASAASRKRASAGV